MPVPGVPRLVARRAAAKSMVWVLRTWSLTPHPDFDGRETNANTAGAYAYTIAYAVCIIHFALVR